MSNDTLTAVEGLRVGHAHDERARTGCTVVIFDPDADVAFEARGGWPGTYDTDSIDVARTFVRKHAIFLTGGDVFGFDVAIGVRRYIVEKGLSSSVVPGKLPGIVGANIYDLEFANVKEAAYSDLGYRACSNTSSEAVVEGNVGAGLGATVGKLRGIGASCKGGCGSSAIRLAHGVVVGALVITNAVGNIYNVEDGKTIAGVRRAGGGFVEFDEIILDERVQASSSNTTIGVVATNVFLSHEQLLKVSQMAHDGLAMSIRPVHTTLDGDTIFAASTARLDETKGGAHSIVDIVGYAAAQCVARAVVRSVKAATDLNAVPGYH